ncbi:MAG TPA: serine/threonine-protein kinase [Verrucomicrobiae bacterium]|nr:serine/threonine-protein kinase [Verrucomicrobiae bacterium]
MSTSSQGEKAVFLEALEISDVQQRRQFLDEACAGDKGLRDAVEELLAAQEAAERFFTESADSLNLAADAAGSPAKSAGVSGKVYEEEGPGYTIGHYKLLDKIGEGGYGIVYLAEQEKPVRRRVALKIIKLGMDTKKVIARFEAERQALALMDHPNIARVFDAGATEKGRPYFVMELVRGLKVTEYCDERHLGLKQRLGLFVQICQAVQHAHQKGIIHRDIKPSNILVRMVNDAPSPAVIDFGIAKATGQQLTDETIFTAHGQLIGTPNYMSPEQVAGSTVDVDTRSDIYSLGALLYELLTGKTPFDTKELLKSGVDEMRRTLIDREPRTPSAKLTAMAPAEQTKAARLRHLEPSKLVSELRGDLDRIVMKALEKDRDRRYQTANDLAMDVERYLNNEPILARPPSQWYRLQKLVRRNRIVFLSGATVAVALAISTVISTLMFFKEREALNSEARLRREAEAREKASHIASLVTQSRFEEADQLSATLPLNQPSVEVAAELRALGNWHAANGRWPEAAMRFKSVGKVNQMDGADVITMDQLDLAAALLKVGDRQAYEDFRETWLKTLSARDIAQDYRTFKLGLLLPVDAKTLQLFNLGAQPAEKTFADVDWVRPSLPHWVQWSEALALLNYRCGSFAAAIGWCDTCQGYPFYDAPRLCTTSMIKAMSEWRLGQYPWAVADWTEAWELIQAKSQQGLNLERNAVPLFPGTRQDLEGSWSDWVIADLLMREGDELFSRTDQTLGLKIPSARDDTVLARSLGEWHAAQGEWERARSHFEFVQQSPQQDEVRASEDYYQEALALLELGDEAGFARLRNQAIDRFKGTTNLAVAEYTLKTILLRRPDIPTSGLNPLVQVLSRSVTAAAPIKGPYSPASWDLMLLGLLEYRRDNFAKAQDWCRESFGVCVYDPLPSASDGFILAMCYHKLGDDTGARLALNRARSLVQSGILWESDKWNWREWAFARLLFKEAEGLIPPGPSPVTPAVTGKSLAHP